MASSKPSIGRTVHYVEQSGSHWAAVVTEIGVPLGDPLQPDPAMRVGLAVLSPASLYFTRGVPYDEGAGPDTWHWPERVE